MAVADYLFWFGRLTPWGAPSQLMGCTTGALDRLWTHWRYFDYERLTGGDE